MHYNSTITIQTKDLEKDEFRLTIEDNRDLLFDVVFEEQYLEQLMMHDPFHQQ
jgi:hypothetical protein